MVVQAVYYQIYIYYTTLPIYINLFGSTVKTDKITIKITSITTSYYIQYSYTAFKWLSFIDLFMQDIAEKLLVVKTLITTYNNVV